MRGSNLFLICIFAAGCGAGNPLSPDVPFRVIGHGGLPAPGGSVRVVRDASAWAEFQAQAALRAPSFDPDDPIPAIDFSREMAVALFLGMRPTTGYQIRVDGIARRGAGLVIHAMELVPCVGATVITHPLSVVAVPIRNGTVDVAWGDPVACR